MRSVIALACFGLATSGVCQQHSFDGPPATLRQLLPKVSEQMGIRLEVTPQVANDVLLLRYKDLEPKEVMDKIAEVTFGEWRRDSEAIRLVRSPERLRNLAGRIETQNRASAIAASIERVSADFARLPALDEQQAKLLAKKYHDQVQALAQGARFDDRIAGAGMPAINAIYDLWRAIGSDELAKIGPGKRVVFSNQPNAMQRPIGGRGQEIVRKAVSEQGRLWEAYKLLEGGTGSITMFGGGGPYIGGESNPASGPGKAIFVITATRNGLTGALTIHDAAGKYLMQGSHHLPFQSGRTPQDDRSSAVEYSSHSVEFAKALAGSEAVTRAGQVKAMVVSNGKALTFESSQSLPPSPSLDSEIEAKLLDPQTFEPHHLISGEVIGKAADGNVIALIPDSAFPTFAREVAASKRTTETANRAITNSGMKLTQSGAWTVLSLTNPLTDIEQRVDRKSLRELAVAARKLGHLRISHLADYAASSSPPMNFGDMPYLYLRTLEPVAASRAEAALNAPATLKVFQGLTVSQKNVLLNGSSIALQDLSPQHRAVLINEMMNSFDGPKLVRDGIWEPNVFFGEGIANERTELLGGSVSLQSTLSLSIESSPSVFGVNSETNERNFLTAPRYAMGVLQGEVTHFGNLGPAPVYDLFQPAHQDVYTFRFTVGPSIMYGKRYDDNWIETASQRVRFDGLPASFRDAVQASLAELREAFKTPPGGTGGSNIPPSE